MPVGYQNLEFNRQRFEKTLEELQILKKISKDLEMYRKMMKIKKYD